MSIARSTIAFVGTNETTGVTIGNNATANGAEVDVFGNNTSAGEIELYLAVTSTVTAGAIQVTVNKRNVTGQVYKKLAPDYIIAPINGTQLIPLDRISAARFMQVDVFNNNTGAIATVVAVLGELYLYS